MLTCESYISVQSEGMEMVGNNSFATENGDFGDRAFEAIRSSLLDPRGIVTGETMVAHAQTESSDTEDTETKVQTMSQPPQVFHVLRMPPPLSQVLEAPQTSLASRVSLASRISQESPESRISLMSQSSPASRVSLESLASRVSQASPASRVSLVSQVSQASLVSQAQPTSQISMAPRMSLVSQAAPELLVSQAPPTSRVSQVSPASRVSLPTSQVVQCHASQIPPASQVLQIPHAPSISQAVKRRFEPGGDDDRFVKRALTNDGAAEIRHRESKEPDRYSVFGQYIACELRELGDLDMERWAKQQIVKIMCEAQERSLPARSGAS